MYFAAKLQHRVAMSSITVFSSSTLLWALLCWFDWCKINPYHSYISYTLCALHRDSLAATSTRTPIANRMISVEPVMALNLRPAASAQWSSSAPLSSLSASLTIEKYETSLKHQFLVRTPPTCQAHPGSQDLTTFSSQHLTALPPRHRHPRVAHPQAGHSNQTRHWYQDGARQTPVNNDKRMKSKDIPTQTLVLNGAILFMWQVCAVYVWRCEKKRHSNPYKTRWP